MVGEKGNNSGESRAGIPPAGGWKRGPGGRPTWDSPEPTKEVVEMLQKRYPEVIVIPEEDLGEERRVWAEHGAVVRSLGRRLSAEVVAREVHLRGGLKGDVQGLQLDRGFFMLRFSLAEERDSFLGRPWVIAGQALAAEAWRPGFFPVEGAVQTALVWIRLPHLPVEFWGVGSLRALLQPAGELVELDEWTAGRRRLGFARACVRISLVQPLRPGTQVLGPEGIFWQRFVYENLDAVCLACGCFHGVGGCSVGGGEKQGAAAKAESHTPTHPGQEGGGIREFGPWLLAVRRWTSAQPGTGRPDHRPPQPTSVVMTRRSGKAAVAENSDPEGWTHPTKVARRRSPPAGRRRGGSLVAWRRRTVGFVGRGQHRPCGRGSVDHSADQCTTEV